MKTFISVLLGSSLLLNGCMSYESLREDTAKGATERVWPAAEEDIKITLRDSSTIEAAWYHHLYLEKPTELVRGVGVRIEKGTEEKSVFDGWILKDSVKSTETVDRQVSCTLVNGAVIRFNKGAYKLDTLNQRGFWCDGWTTVKGVRLHYIGAKPYEDIREVEVVKFSPAKTTFLVLVVVTAALAVLLVVVDAALKGLGPHVTYPY
jgi:hypothetical protein